MTEPASLMDALERLDPVQLLDLMIVQAERRLKVLRDQREALAAREELLATQPLATSPTPQSSQPSAGKPTPTGEYFNPLWVRLAKAMEAGRWYSGVELGALVGAKDTSAHQAVKNHPDVFERTVDQTPSQSRKTTVKYRKKEVA